MPDLKHCSSLLLSLDFAADVARDFLSPVPEEWVDCARKVKVPFDVEKKYHPEYDGYSPGERRGAGRPVSWSPLFLCQPASSGDSVGFRRGNSGCVECLQRCSQCCVWAASVESLAHKTGS